MGGIARFLTLFGLYLLAGHLVLSSSAGDRGLVGPWTRANVVLSGGICTLVGTEAWAERSYLASATTRLDINKGCDGTTALLILSAAILAFPAAWRSRLIGVALGLLAVFVVNAFRIASLLLVAVHWPTRLDFFHVDVWQPAMMLVAFGLFLAWGLWLAGPVPVGTRAPADDRARG